MDPVTASILIGMAIASTAVSVNQYNKQVRAQNQLRKDQESLRVDSVRAEIGASEQRTNTALAGAANRNKSAQMSPSFAQAALVGNQTSTAPTNNNPSNVGSSGTF